MKILIALLAALVLVPAASAAYPAPYATQTLDRTLPSLDGSIQYAAGKSSNGTLVVANRTEGGATLMSTIVPGAFGIPVLTQSGLAGGMFHDGSAFVLQQAGFNNTSSHFAIVGTKDLKVQQTVALKGTFGFDAVSPNGSMLYLIQHQTANDWNHYIVRAYNLRTHKLLPRRIADKTQKSWVMQGWAVSRSETPDGRWQYTLYANPGGYPFIHALDTVRGVAHCIGLPWNGSDTDLWNLRLAVDGPSVSIITAAGTTWRTMDRTTWKLSRP